MRPRHSGDAIARAAHDALGSPVADIGGPAGGSGGYDHLADGAENYDRSFEED